MKAAVVTQFGEPLVLEDRPVPEPGAGQITIKMIASGLCHTDIHAVHGDWPVQPTPPLVPGHVGVGTVSAVGAAVTGFEPGDLVAVPWLG
jgi:propanol-preferring alcohol dehydrogenase